MLETKIFVLKKYEVDTQTVNTIFTRCFWSAEKARVFAQKNMGASKHYRKVKLTWTMLAKRGKEEYKSSNHSIPNTPLYVYFEITTLTVYGKRKIKPQSAGY